MPSKLFRVRRLGDWTIDEMNIGWLDFYYISDEEFAQIQKEQNAARRTGAHH